MKSTQHWIRVVWRLLLIGLLAGCASTERRETSAAAQTHTFDYADAAARSVGVAGSFNDWRPDATPMQRADNGHWSVTVELPPGTYQYLFVIDGSDWVPDPTAAHGIDDGFGRANSLVVVE